MMEGGTSTVKQGKKKTFPVFLIFLVWLLRKQATSPFGGGLSSLIDYVL